MYLVFSSGAVESKKRAVIPEVSPAPLSSPSTINREALRLMLCSFDESSPQIGQGERHAVS